MGKTSIRFIVNYFVEYDIAFDLRLSNIESRFIKYVEIFQSIRLITLLSYM